MRFELSPLSLSISLQALAVCVRARVYVCVGGGAFGSFPVRLSLLNHSKGRLMRRGVDTITSCSAKCGAGLATLVN